VTGPTPWRAGRAAFLLAAAALAAAAGCAGSLTLGTVEERLAPYRAADEAAAKAHPGPLTLRAAIERALAVSPTVAARRTAIQTALEEVRAARDLRDPELRLGYGEGDLTGSQWQSETNILTETNIPFIVWTNLNSQEESSTSLRLAVRVFPDHPWQRSARVSSRRANFHAAECALEAERNLVAVQVRTWFETLRRARREGELLAQIAAGHLALARTLRASAEGAGATEVESAAAAAAYLRSLSDRSRALRERELAERELARLLELGPAQMELDLDSDALAPGDLLSETSESLEQIAMAARADLAQLSWLRRAAEADVREARATRIPWFTFIEASMGWNEGERVSSDLTVTNLYRLREADTFSERESHEWEVQTAVNVPLFSWFNRADDALAARTAEAATLEADAVRAMRLDVRLMQERLRALSEDESALIEEAKPIIDDLRRAAGSTGLERLSLPDANRIREEAVEAERLLVELESERRLLEVEFLGVLGIAVPYRVEAGSAPPPKRREP
jgi:outer membrane protein TolC